MALRFLKALRDMFRSRRGRGHGSRFRNYILDEYKLKRPLYEEYTLAIHKLLDSYLRENNYKFQLASRTKSPEQLQEKITRKSSRGIRYKHLADIEDLSGVRVIFYSENDVQRFIQEIREEFSGSIRIEEHEEKSGYRATHLIVELGAKRLQLSEYKRFYAMKCEVQVTTIFRHAWAEVEHDLIYKDVMQLKKRNPLKFSIMKKRLKKIMNTYLTRASREFDEVIRDASS